MYEGTIGQTGEGVVPQRKPPERPQAHEGQVRQVGDEVRLEVEGVKQFLRLEAVVGNRRNSEMMNYR